MQSAGRLDIVNTGMYRVLMGATEILAARVEIRISECSA